MPIIIISIIIISSSIIITITGLACSQAFCRKEKGLFAGYNMWYVQGKRTPKLEVKTKNVLLPSQPSKITT